MTASPIHGLFYCVVIRTVCVHQPTSSLPIGADTLHVNYILLMLFCLQY